MHRTHLLALFFGAAVALGGCGGAATVTPGAATAGAPSAPPQGQASAVLPPSQGTSGGGMGDAEICGLVTLAEVTGAVGVSAMSTQATPPSGGQSACNYFDANGVPVFGHVLTTPNEFIVPGQLFDGFVASGEAVPGVGDRAVWVAVPGTELGTLYVMVGESLYSASVLDTQPDTAEHRRTGAIELAKQAVGRLR